MNDRYASARYDHVGEKKLLFFLNHFPFAVLIPENRHEGTTYCPIAPVINERGEAGLDRLYGHLDSSNPMLDILENAVVTAILVGPNGYVSPLDYGTRQYPTWNYSLLEIRGMSALIRDEGEKKTLMVHFIHRFEGPDQDCVNTTSAEFREMLGKVTFFSIDVRATSARFKYSQEKSSNDRSRAAAGLRSRIVSTLDASLSRLADLSEIY